MRCGRYSDLEHKANQAQCFVGVFDVWGLLQAQTDIEEESLWDDMILASPVDETAYIISEDGNLIDPEYNELYYIDENNFKYYYYLSLVLRAKGDIDKSNQSLVKCSRLNSDYAANVNPGHSIYEE